MVKYQLTYKDVLGNNYQCNISNENYDGDLVAIQGYCVLDYPKIDNIYQVIRGSGMRLTLEANQALTLEDLYADGEKEYEVTLSRNEVTIFRGFIDPAGLSEDLVNNVWEVTLDCVDGLALLENLSYVDSQGFPYTGKKSDIETIYNCLQRTGLTADDGSPFTIISSINTRYNGLNASLCPLESTFSNQDRFYKDDGETIMSCREVLESTLKKYGGCIIQENGNWNLFSFYELLGPERYFYTYKGSTLQSSTITNYSSQDIGSEINGAFPHWCNANQRKEIIAPVGAVKINYQYGFVKSLIENTDFTHDGVSINQWNILNNQLLSLGSDGRYINIITGDGSENVIETIEYDVSINDSLLFVFKTYLLPETPIGNYQTRLFLRFKIFITNGNVTYYLNSNGTWSTNDTNYQFIRAGIYFNNPEFTLNIDPDPMPISGDIKVIILRPRTTRFFNNTGEETYQRTLQFKEASVTIKSDESVQGETHTQQVSGKNTRIEEVIEVSVGDNPSDIYLGAIYKADAEENTTLWNTIYTPTDIVNPQSILEILSEYISIYRKEVSYLISGDVYGYFSPLRLYNLDLVPNKTFTLSSYSFDTKEGVTTSEFSELKRSSYFGNTYEFALDYGNVNKPTIVG